MVCVQKPRMYRPRRARRQLISVFSGLLASTCNINAVAQSCAGIPGLLFNGSFENPDVTQPTPVADQTFGTPPIVVRIYDENDVPNWNTSASDDSIELWRSGFSGVDSFDGDQHAELNANIAGGLYQDLVTTPNTTALWQFAHRGRSGVDTAEVLIGPPGGPLVSQGTFSTGTNDWDIKSGEYIIPPGQPITRFEFRAVSTASGSASVGNFIDAVRIVPECDYGDAPSSFPVARANNGAAHLILVNTFLGSSADPEVDGSSAGGNATADDNTNQDDEDGVTFGTLGSGELDRGTSNPISITASVPGYVNLWIDLDGDGNWQANERLLADTSVAAGTQSLNVAIPLNINTGQRFARIRYTTDDPQGALGPGGDWPNGEVEDYAVDITSLTARLDATKTVAIFDPFSQGLFHIPQNDVTYTIVVENIGDTPTDSGSIFLVDRLPPEAVSYTHLTLPTIYSV